jgi:exosortase/archaeosortase family protein
MIEYLVLISCVGFLAFLVPGRHRKYAAIIGWTFIVLSLFTLLPYYFSQNNFLYPVMAALSVPFLVITTKYLLAEDYRVMQLSRAAAVAFLIYAPFEYIPALGDWLISVVVGQVVWILDALNYTVTLPTIYILNLLRNVFVIIAYTEQWFPYYPAIASNGEFGYESFFWAHNVIAELLALFFLVIIAYGLFSLIPNLGKFADELYHLYSGEIRKAFGKGK